MLTYAQALTALITRDAPTAQRLPDTGPADGRWGPRTERGLLYHLDTEWKRLCAENAWRYTRTAEANPTSGGYRREPIRRTIIHWPGAGDWTADRLDRLIHRRAIGAALGSGSTHFSLDEGEVVCHCAPHIVAWHAKAHNWDSIGIDICYSPLDADAMRARGIFVGTVQWSGSPKHGSTWVQIHPAMAQRAFYLWRRLSSILGDTLVYDHAHVDPGRKIDCIPWRPALARQPWAFNQEGACDEG